MTKRVKHSSPGQLPLFEYLRETMDASKTPPKGSLDIRSELKLALSEDLRHATDERGRELSRAS